MQGISLASHGKQIKTTAVKLLKEVNAMVVADTLDAIEKRKKSPDSSANQTPDIQTTAHHYADYINHKILAKSSMVGFGPLLLKKEYIKANSGDPFFWLSLSLSIYIYIYTHISVGNHLGVFAWSHSSKDQGLDCGWMSSVPPNSIKWEVLNFIFYKLPRDDVISSALLQYGWNVTISPIMKFYTITIADSQD
jgi:hypothetical protein